ncbi:hypothetical protein [Demequina sp.]|uniref:hypothetical protein n=1 Tax=Demequina sp. TaxID=2050685 RepID=UPI003D0F0712
MSDNPHVRKAQAMARAREAEAATARVLVEQFARDAIAAGVRPERLTARAYNGSTRYKTQVTGWYLKRDRSLGISTDGVFYVLSTAGGVAARFTGVTLEPGEPLLEIGRGARDGESMPLTDALAGRLAAGNDWKPA